MKIRNDLLLSLEDYNRLSNIIANSDSDRYESLMSELDRAQVVPVDDVPPSVVKMNSTVIFRDLETNEESQVTLVYPEHADIATKKISVLAPMGSALIGLSEGQSIEWKMPSGKVRKISVVRVLNTIGAEHAPSF